jgi:hypothetical protein
MAFPGGPYRSAVTAVRSRSAGVVFAVGRHVFVASPSARTPGVTLTDDSGATPCGKLRDGAEVEIVAWRPRGSQGTRYLVRSSSKGVEGWLAAGELRGARARPAGS